MDRRLAYEEAIEKAMLLERSSHAVTIWVKVAKWPSFRLLYARPRDSTGSQGHHLLFDPCPGALKMDFLHCRSETSCR
jgi:hypothetical protein